MDHQRLQKYTKRVTLIETIKQQYGEIVILCKLAISPNYKKKSSIIIMNNQVYIDFS